MRHFTLSVFLTIASFAIAGCGGSDSAPPATGKVAVLFTDGPSEDFEQIIITLDRMLLLGGDGGHQVLYEAESQDKRITFDLLAMRDRADFAFASEVLADDYSKIRLEITEQIQLVYPNGTESTPIELVDPPANGKIDLNPQGPFTVLPGQTLVVELDMDANRSFHAVEQGNGGGYRLRPVIFVNVYPGDFILRSQLVRVFGTVDANGFTGTDTEKSGLVCGLSFVPQIGAPVPGDPQDCVRIFATENTSIFGANGLAPAMPSIAPNDQLTGIGSVTADGADALFNLDAVVIEIWPKTATDPGWETLRGTITSPLGGCDMDTDPYCFEFDVFGSGTPIKTRLQSATRVFDSRGAILDRLDIKDMDIGTVDGMRPSIGAEELHAALVVLNAETSEGFVSGLLTAPVSTMGSYDVLMVDAMAVCVDEETDFLRILVNDDTVTIANVTDLSTLEVEVVMDTVEATGTSDVGTTGCHLIADVVIVEKVSTP